MSGASPVSYRVDDDDVIVWVNDAFSAFATANGAPGLAEQVIGRSLFDSIHGDEVRLLWRLLLARTRGGATLSIPYRCDAATEKRELTMAISSPEDGSVGFTSTTLAVSERMPLPLFGAGAGIGSLLNACSWCCRFEVGAWVEAEEAVRILGLLSSAPPRVTHGLCPDCALRLKNDLGLAETA